MIIQKQTTQQSETNLDKLTKSIEDIPCQFNPKHKLRIKSLKNNKFVLWCLVCSQSGINVEVRGVINDNPKTNNTRIRNR